eukprot:3563073-Amphidinium_carterae.1
MRSGLRLLVIAAAVCLFCGPSAFVSSPTRSLEASVGNQLAAATSGVVAAGMSLPAFAERIPGGKFTKAQGKIVATPDEDGFTDSEVALALIIAAVVLYLAIEVTKSLFY